MNGDQARGMLVGLAVGDALGAPLEFHGSREPNEYITDMIGGGCHSVDIGEWTDDTSMALAIADSYLEEGEFNATTIAENYHKWVMYGEFSYRGRCFDIGITTKAAVDYMDISMFERPYSGSTAVSTSGNGALMRMAPVIIANHADWSAALVDATRQTIMTHASTECVQYSMAFAEDLFTCGQSDKYKRLRLPSSTPREQVMSGGYVKETYECAWWAIDNSSSFEDALVLAINRGHDSDTVGAVTGQLAGSIYGYSSIPKRWIEAVVWEDRISRIAESLYAAGLRG